MGLPVPISVSKRMGFEQYHEPANELDQETRTCARTCAHTCAHIVAPLTEEAEEAIN
jgi:hypothetical protein